MNENDTSDPPLTEVLGRLERDGDAVSVDFDRLFATDAADLWQICTDPDRLARWFAPVSGGLRPGGSFVIHFDDDDTPRCRVVACEPPTSFVWEWPIGDIATLVSVTVSPDDAGARLRVRHERLTPGQAAGYGAGWHTHLRCLDAEVAGSPSPDRGATWTALLGRYTALSEA